MAQKPENGISTRQKVINITGSLIVGASLLALGGTWKILMDLKSTVNKSDMNTKSIEKLIGDLEDKNRVYHMRISENQKDIIMLRERTKGMETKIDMIWEIIKYK